MKKYFYLFIIAVSFISSGTLAQTAGDYRSAASGDWTSPNSWQMHDGTNWSAATNYPSSADGYIIIAGGHTVTIPSGSAIIADQIIVKENAKIIVAIDGTLELANGTGTDLDLAQAVIGTVPGIVKVNGTLKTQNDAIIESKENSLFIEDGGIYEHHYTTSSGSIPIATWQTGSALLISGYTSNETAPGNLGQAFHHVVWNTPHLNNPQGSIKLDGSFKTVYGTFTINSTGNNLLLISGASTDVLTVSNNFVIQNSASVQINSDLVVKGALILSNSTLENSSGLILANKATFLLEGSSVFKGASPTAQEAYSIHYKDLTTPRTTGLEFPANETELLNVVIQNSTVSLSNPTTVNGNLTLEESGVLRQNGQTLFLKGNFINHGTLEAGTNKTVFSGANPQHIEGTITPVFYDLEIMNQTVPGLTANQHVNISNSLTLGDGVVFDPDGGDLTSDGGINVTLLSSAYNKAAALRPLPATSKIEGNLVVQVYIPPVKMYRYITTPTRNVTLSQWADDFDIYGSFEGGLGGNASLYVWNEPTSAFKEYPGPNGSLSSPIEVGKGYVAYMYSDVPTIISTRGPANSGDFTFSLSFTESTSAKGDNFIGNPYPSPVDWASPHWQRQNVGPTLRIYNRVAGKNVYSILNSVTGIGLNAENTQVSTGLGFYVDALATGAKLTASEMVKVTNSAPPSITDVIVVSFFNSTFKDQMALAFREGASNIFEPEYDSPKTKNTSINIYSLTPDGREVAHNIQPWFNCSLDIPLVIDQAPVGSYQLSFSHLESLSKEVDIVLQDSYLNTNTAVSAETSYSFNITSDVLTYKNRFKLLISYKSIPEIRTITYETSCTESIPVTINGTVPGINYQLYNGTTAVTAPIPATSDVTSFTISSTDLTEGSNTITVRAFYEGCSHSTMATELTINYSSYYAISSTEGASTCTSEALTLTATASSPDATFKWYESLDAATTVYESSTGSYTTPVLSTSKTYYVAAVNSSGCESARVAVEATVLNLAQPMITIDENTLVSNYASGNQWIFNGSPIANATESSFTAVESGIYSLIVTTQGCTLNSEEVPFTVTGIREKQAENTILIYPNPAQNTIKIKTALFQGNKKISYQIYQQNGTIVHQGTIINPDSVINIEILKTGFYVVKVMAGGKVQYINLIKR